MKYFYFFLALFFSLNIGFSQQKFYETSWTSNNVSYTGLLIYNSDNDAFMRVKYKANNSDKVAEFKCYKISFNEGDIKGYYWDGRNANLVKGSGSGYSADNFYFIDKGGYYSKPMHIDDYGMEQNNKASYYTQVSYWKEIQPNKFTKSYVSSFFYSYESYYDKLIMLKLTSSTMLPTTSSNTSNNSFLNTNKKSTNTTIPEDSDLGSIYNYSIGSYSEKWIVRSNFPKTDIDNLWDRGYEINSFTYSKNKWIIDFTKRKNFNNQRWRTRVNFPKEEISKGWDSGFLISSITYGNGVWAVNMSKGTGYFQQMWRTRKLYPREEIDKGWEQGKRITQLGYYDGLWVLVMSKGTGFYSQSIFRDVEMPTEKIRKGWDEGKHITSFTYGNGKWIVVMSKGTKYSTQRWRTRSYFPKEEIEKGWKDGFEITALEYNESTNLWGLIMSKVKN
ncbi:DUF7477 domain-containing protein [Winogradskyella aquimaris]|uniref:DUF7477 domain-containing protein n=1 Tax=Winogradskyella aquimaris TaxID=864074 RepID=A0ABU5EIS6_9FLAO|nr:hypothetical protein [Winogradskyella aquimaris]MDY2586221.1 hypothetical protein [Winogradskyella aquimaris]